MISLANPSQKSGGRASKRPQKAQAARRGFTTIELIVTVLVMSLVMSGLATLLYSHWTSYFDTMYQNRVNQQARQALDAICDDIRMGGSPHDQLNDIAAVPQQIFDGSVKEQAGISTPETKEFWYLVGKNSNGISCLRRANSDGSPPSSDGGAIMATDIDSVKFEYEYRVRSNASQNASWTYQRTSTPTTNTGTGQIYWISTIYVTVTAKYPTDGTINGQVYTRTLTSAVHLRRPLNSIVPIAAPKQ